MGLGSERVKGDSFNPFTAKGSPFDELNHLVLDRVKSISQGRKLGPSERLGQVTFLFGQGKT